MSKHIGVKFVYEEETQPSTEEVLKPEALASLPAEWLDTLKQGARLADFMLICGVIEQIRKHDAEVADALTGLAEDFEYDGILALVQKTERS